VTGLEPTSTLDRKDTFFAPFLVHYESDAAGEWFDQRRSNDFLKGQVDCGGSDESTSDVRFAWPRFAFLSGKSEIEREDAEKAKVMKANV
jgi:hypothetical protein